MITITITIETTTQAILSIPCNAKSSYIDTIKMHDYMQFLSDSVL